MVTTTDSNTTINVNPGTPNVPEPPEFRIPQRPAEEPPIAAGPASAPTHETTRTTRTVSEGPRVDTYRRSAAPTNSSGLGSVNGKNVEITERPGRVDTHTHHRPNWGGIVKGALIVSAVALAAVVAITVVPPLAAGAIEALGLGPMLSSVYATVGPVLATVGDIALSGFAFVSSFLNTAIAGIGAAIGIGGGTAAATAASTAAATAATSATGTAVGYVAAGGVIAAGAPLAAKALMTQPMVDAVQHTVVTPAQTTVTGMEDGGASATHTAAPDQTTTTTTTVTEPSAGHGHGHSGNHTSRDAADAHDLHQQASNMKTASKMSHHAAEAGEGHDGGDADAGEPDAPERRTRHALRNTANRSGEWANRVNAGLTNRDRALLSRHETHLGQVDADRATLADSVVRA